MPTRKGSDNRFPLLRLTQADDTPATPPSGESHLVVGVDKVLRYIDDDGVLTDIGTVASLDDVGDVNAPTPSNGDVLTWDSTPGEWVSAAPAAGIAELDDVPDVNAPSPSDGQVLTWDSTPGEWVAATPAGGSSAFHGFRAVTNATSAIANGSFTPINMAGTDLIDTDAYHFTSAANLTGTVSKTASSTTITGSGTSFTTELSVNQIISVPGTAAEKLVVTAIASNTSLTVAVAPVNTASGQTATRVNSAIAIPAGRGGYYALSANGEWDTANTITDSILKILVNGTVEVGWTRTASGLGNGWSLPVVAAPYLLAAGDYVEFQGYQASGGTRNVGGNGRTFLAGFLIGT